MRNSKKWPKDRLIYTRYKLFFSFSFFHKHHDRFTKDFVGETWRSSFKGHEVVQGKQHKGPRRETGGPEPSEDQADTSPPEF